MVSLAFIYRPFRVEGTKVGTYSVSIGTASYINT